MSRMLVFITLVIGCSADHSMKTNYTFGIPFYIQNPEMIAKYLNDEVSNTFSPPIHFETTYFDNVGLISVEELETTDFALLTPKNNKCIDIEKGLLQIAQLSTTNNQGQTTRGFGSVIFTHINSDIHTLLDTRDASVSLLGIDGLVTFDAAAQQFSRVGIEPLSDFKQIRIVTNPFQISADVISGVANIGIVPSELYNILPNTQSFRVLNKRNTSSCGEPYPYELSTETFPMWTVVSAKETNEDVVKSVLVALLNMPPFVMQVHNSTFEVPMNLGGLYSVFFERGLIEIKDGKFQCVRGNETYDKIACPYGYYKRSHSEYDAMCSSMGLQGCHNGTECICKPCHRVSPVSVFFSDRGFSNNTSGLTICSRLETCATVSQQQRINLILVDNQRRGLPLRYVFNVMSSKLEKEGILYPDENFHYTLELVTADIGRNFLEFFIEMDMILVSPVVIEVLERECEDGYKADKEGYCQKTIENSYLPIWFNVITYIAASIGVLFSVISALWTFFLRSTRLINAAQPLFLYMFCFGCAMAASSLIFITLNDREGSIGTYFGPAEGCMTGFWLWSSGTTLAFSSLAVKVLRTKNLVMIVPGQTARKEQLPYVCLVIVAVLIDSLIMTFMTIFTPLKYERFCSESSTSDYCHSIGRCQHQDAEVSLTINISLKFLLLLSTLCLCYQARLIPEEFVEHKWITAAGVSTLETLVVAPLLINLTWNQNLAADIVLALSAFLTSTLTPMMIFIPKMTMLMRNHTDKLMTLEDILFNLRRSARDTNFNKPQNSNIATFMDIKSHRKKSAEMFNRIVGDVDRGEMVTRIETRSPRDSPTNTRMRRSISPSSKCRSLKSGKFYNQTKSSRNSMSRSGELLTPQKNSSIRSRIELSKEIEHSRMPSLNRQRTEKELSLRDNKSNNQLSPFAVRTIISTSNTNSTSRPVSPNRTSILRAASLRKFSET